MNLPIDPAILERIRIMRQQGRKYREIADALGMSVEAVQGLADIYKFRYLGPSPFWSNGRTARAHQMAKDGFSASQIGTDLGCSRNAVIGKLHRAHVEWHPHPATKHGNQDKSRPRPPNGRVGPPTLRVVPGPIELTQEPPSSSWVRFGDLAYHHCRWPVAGDPGPDMMCCGAHRVEQARYEYCAYHLRKGTTRSSQS